MFSYSNKVRVIMYEAYMFRNRESELGASSLFKPIRDYGLQSVVDNTTRVELL